MHSAWVHHDQRGARSLEPEAWSLKAALKSEVCRCLSPLPNCGSALGEQLDQDGSMAVARILAVASDRDVGHARQGGDELQHARRFGATHLRPISPRETLPRLVVTNSGSRRFHERGAGREIRKPDVEPVFGAVAILSDTPGQVAHCSQAKALFRKASGSELNGNDGHVSRRGYGPRSTGGSDYYGGLKPRRHRCDRITHAGRTFRSAIPISRYA